MVIGLQKGIIYGPVQSRRLGPSLGINVLSRNRKVCSFNCVYCQYGWTNVKTSSLEDGNTDMSFPTPGEIRTALRCALRQLKSEHRLPLYATLSGNGESTLHPLFGEIVNGIIETRDETAPSVKTAILSNSSSAGNPSVREALARLDVRIMKLDCGRMNVFRRFNRPPRELDIDTLTANLQRLSEQSPVIVQSLFASGPSGNVQDRNIRDWVDRVTAIRPRMVQIYTLDREWPDARLRPATPADLLDVQCRLEDANMLSRVYL